MRNIKIIAYAAGVLALFFFLASFMGVVGFHYPHVIQDQPLNSPIKVIRIDGNRLILQDKRVIEVEDYSNQDLTNQLAQSDFMIEIENGAANFVGVYARQNGWICGTPWAQPIRIPMFRDTVYRNRRELISWPTTITLPS